MWCLLRPNIPKNAKTQMSDEKTRKAKKKHSLKPRQGHTKHMCKISGSTSQKRRGHWHLKEFWVLCLNQPVYMPALLWHSSAYLLLYYCCSSTAVAVVLLSYTHCGFMGYSWMFFFYYSCVLCCSTAVPGTIIYTCISTAAVVGTTYCCCSTGWLGGSVRGCVHAFVGYIL